MSYSSRDWKDHYASFSVELTRKAAGQGLDSESLQSALSLILKDSGDLAYLPVGAYQASLNGRQVWVVSVKWEAVVMGDPGLSHIRIFAFDQETLKQVGFATCG